MIQIMIDPTRDVLRSFRMHVVNVEIARVQFHYAIATGHPISNSTESGGNLKRTGKTMNLNGHQRCIESRCNRMVAMLMRPTSSKFRFALNSDRITVASPTLLAVPARVGHGLVRPAASASPHFHVVPYSTLPCPEVQYGHVVSQMDSVTPQRLHRRRAHTHTHACTVPIGKPMLLRKHKVAASRFSFRRECGHVRGCGSTHSLVQVTR